MNANELAAQAVDDRRFGSFPPISDALLDALRTEFPDRCPPVGTESCLVNAMAGQQDVIKFLASAQDFQLGRVDTTGQAEFVFSEGILGDLDNL